MPTPIPFTIAATLALLAAEWRDWRPGVWLAKPLAALGFVWAALWFGAIETPYGVWILGGLLLSALGDVLLIPRGARMYFVAGLGAFLLAHVAYVGAFALRGLELRSMAAAAVPVAAASLFALRSLWPSVQRNAPRLQYPVLVYVAVISTMVVCAAGAAAKTGRVSMLVGALAFYASDLAVARHRFVAPTFSNKLWGTPLYFGAQLVLASTVAPPP